MHPECLPPNGLKVLRRLNALVKAHEFVLAGGTALTLRIGHRLSEDLDFFTEKPFSTERLFVEMQNLKLSPAVMQEEEGTLVTVAGGVKVSMMRYEHPFIDRPERFRGIPVAGIVDIASMKIIAISQRGAKRDFADLYFVLQDVPFWKIAENMMERFGPDRINPVHVGKSLVYFIDAEIDPDPRYRVNRKPKWERIKSFYKKNVRQMVLDLHTAKENIAEG